MDGKILLDGLLGLSGNDLRMVYALLCKTKIHNLLHSKGKDLFGGRDANHFSSHLKDLAEDANKLSDDYIRMEVFLEFNRILRLQGSRYVTGRDFEEKAESVMEHAYNHMLEKDKAFKQFIFKNTSSSKLRSIINYQMSKVFDKVFDKVSDSDGDNQQLINSIRDYINDLPEHQQLVIRKKLGLEDLSNDMLRKFIATSGSSILFAVIVDVSGFAFYTTLTSSIAAFAGIFGITLPFTVYTTATSIVSVLVSPFFIIPLVVLGGGVLVSSQNKKLKKGLLPIVIMQITLPNLIAKKEIVGSLSGMLSEWSARYTEYLNVDRKIRDIREKHSRLEQQVKHIGRSIDDIYTQITVCESTMDSMIRKIEEKIILGELPGKDISLKFHSLWRSYQFNIREMTALKTAKPEGNNFLVKGWNQLTTKLSYRDLEKKGKQKLADMVQEFLRAIHPYMKVEKENYEQAYRVLQERKSTLTKQKSNLKELKKEQQQVENKISSLIQQKKILEEKTYGLKDISLQHDVLEIKS